MQTSGGYSMFILNEEEYIRTILINKQKPNGMTYKLLITLIAKYYFNNCDTTEQLIQVVKDKLLEFDLPGYQEYKMYPTIRAVCLSLYDQDLDDTYRTLKKIDFVPIYNYEIAIVNSLETNRLKKLMFTLFAIARYADCNGWINKKDIDGLSEIFKLSNIVDSSAKKNELLHILYTKGLIALPKRVDNLNIRVVDFLSGNELDNSIIVYKIINFENIGNQYISVFKRGYKMCKSCGKIIRNTSNSRIYCDKCAMESTYQNKINYKDRIKNS